MVCVLAPRASPSVPYAIEISGMETMTQSARTTALMTADEFLLCDVPDGKAELVRGELRVTPPAGGPHATVQSNLFARLASYVNQHRLGRVFGDGTGYELIQLPRTVRVPDLSFVRADRLPAGGIGPGLFKWAPDLAVEVLSPSESASELQEKLDDLQVGGARLIWVADPRRGTVTVHDGDAPVRTLRGDESLDGGAVVPGFSCRIGDVFEGIAPDL